MGLSQMASFLNFWLPPRLEPEVAPGHCYSRCRRDNVTERATVMELRADAHGIPHVRFALAFEKPSIGRVEGGLRMLALRAFVAVYRQRDA